MKSLSVEQSRRLDTRAIETFGIPAFVLMDHAGKAVAEATHSLMRGKKKLVVLTGGGNNGSDGVVAARWLKGWGFPVEVLWLQNPAEWKGSAALHFAIARRLGVRFRPFLKLPSSRRVSYLKGASVLIDALLGTGISGHLRLPYFDAIASINAARRPVVAVDIPSGLNGDQGRPLDIGVHASVTVTMAAPKKGLLKPAARPYVGRLVVADIGVPL